MLHSAICYLRDELRGWSNLQVERVLFDGLNLVALSNTTSQMQHRLLLDENYLRLLGVGEQASIAFDLASLRDALVKGLPSAGVRTAYLACVAGAAEGRAAIRDVPARRRAGGERERGVPREPVAPAGRADERRRGKASWSSRWRSRTSCWASSPSAIPTGSTPTRRSATRSRLRSRASACARSWCRRACCTNAACRNDWPRRSEWRRLSVLAGGVAHDLNNALGPLVALPDVILAQLGEMQGNAGLRSRPAHRRRDHQGGLAPCRPDHQGPAHARPPGTNGQGESRHQPRDQVVLGQQLASVRRRAAPASRQHDRGPQPDAAGRPRIGVAAGEGRRQPDSQRGRGDRPGTARSSSRAPRSTFSSRGRAMRSFRPVATRRCPCPTTAAASNAARARPGLRTVLHQEAREGDLGVRPGTRHRPWRRQGTRGIHRRHQHARRGNHHLPVLPARRRLGAPGTGAGRAARERAHPHRRRRADSAAHRTTRARSPRIRGRGHGQRPARLRALQPGGRPRVRARSTWSSWTWCWAKRSMVCKSSNRSSVCSRRRRSSSSAVTRRPSARSCAVKKGLTWLGKPYGMETLAQTVQQVLRDDGRHQSTG